MGHLLGRRLCAVRPVTTPSSLSPFGSLFRFLAITLLPAHTGFAGFLTSAQCSAVLKYYNGTGIKYAGSSHPLSIGLWVLREPLY